MNGMHPGGAAAHPGMWIAMMVAMMLPSLIPMLSSYRRSVRTKGIHLHGLTALVGAGYFSMWAAAGAAACFVGGAITGIETRPVAAGALLLLAGVVQLTPWKARRLAMCREQSGCGPDAAASELGALRHGLRLGLRCGLCCGSLMVAMLTAGMMNPAVMALGTLAISAERLGPAPMRIARAVGVALIVFGVQTIGRA